MTKKKTLHGPMKHRIIRSISQSENCKPVQKTAQPLILMRNKYCDKMYSAEPPDWEPVPNRNNFVTTLQNLLNIKKIRSLTRAVWSSCFLWLKIKRSRPLKIQSSWSQVGFGDSIGAERSLVQHWPVSGPVDRYHRFRCAHRYKGSFVQNREGWNQ